MNNISKKIFAMMLMSATAVTAIAQESATGYFMDNYNMRWQMNPAMGNRHSYVGFPGIGNVNVSLAGNLKPTSIVYPLDGKTVLFTNPAISTPDAMSKFGKVNRISENLKLGVIQVGFKAFGGYNNVAINIKEDMSFDLPKGLFEIAKEGLTNKTYDITDIRAKAKAYAEIALNHSREIKQVEGLRVGASLKFLLPVAFAEANFKELGLDLGTDTWRIRSNAEMRIGLKGSKFETKLNNQNHEYVSGVDLDDIKYSPNGFGFGVDLGATYKWREFTFSLGLTDLGMLGFNSVAIASTGGTKIVNTNDHPISIGDDSDKSWDALTDDLATLYELNDEGVKSSSVALDGKMRIGVDYEFPFYKKLHFGLMNTTNLSSIFPMTEFRLSANVEPVRGVAVSVSGAAGTYGANYGFLLSLGNKGFNFLIGMDYAALKMDKNHYPLTSNCDFHMGINFPF